MSRKKIDVIELNKVKERILLEERSSGFILFFKKYGKLLLLILLALILILAIPFAYLFINGLNKSLDITQIQMDITGLESTAINIDSNHSLTDDSARNMFKRTGKFKPDGEVLLVKTVTTDNFTVKFYSDGTAIKILNGGLVTRINSLKDGSYGISYEGIIKSGAETKDVTITKTIKYEWGTVNYFSDGSAEVISSDVDMFVRNGKDVNEKYISNNKVSYVKETKNIGNNTKVTYYYDGTIEVNVNGKSYLVRNSEDIKIQGSKVTFPNNNEATITKTLKCDDGRIIDYYSDGGAIIKDNGKTISVRKSNSIVIKDNKIFEIVDSIYVEEASKKGNTTYYTNGGAVTNYNGEKVYVHENSNIKNPATNPKITGDYERKTKDNQQDGITVTTFETVAIVETPEYKAIVPKDGVLINSDGTFKEIVDLEDNDDDDNTNSFSITNPNNKRARYRVVIERSDRTSVDVQYIRYQLTAKDIYVEPSRLDKNIWQDKALASKLSAKGINYILIDDTIEAFETIDIKLMLWTDYDTIPNAMQNKYFYGTIKIYSWIEN